MTLNLQKHMRWSLGLIAIIICNFSYAQYFSWAIPNGGGMLQRSQGERDDNQVIATDHDGNTYVVGTFDGTQDFDPGLGNAPLTSIIPGRSCIFLAKYDADGAHVWSKSIAGGFSGGGVTAVTADQSGQITVYGQFKDTLYYQDTSGLNFVISPREAGKQVPYAAFLIQYNDVGDFLWIKTILPSLAGQSRCIIYPYGNIRTDNSANIYIAGFFEGAFDFNPNETQFELIEGNRGNMTGYVAKYTAAGNLVWAKGIGVDTDTSLSFGLRITNMAVDTQKGLNEVILAGNFSGDVDFDPGQGQSVLSDVGGGDIFLQKLDSNGTFQWVKQIGGSKMDQLEGLCLSSFGNLYVSGITQSDDADFDPSVDTAILSRGLSYMSFYVAKFTNEGEYTWAKTIGDSGVMTGWINHTTDNYENLYIVGNLTDDPVFYPGADGVEFGTYPNSTKLYFDPLTPGGFFRGLCFIAQYDACGNSLWAGKFTGSEGSVFSSGISVYPVSVDSMAIFLAGEKRKTADPAYLFTDFDPGPDTFQIENWPDDYMNFLMKMTFTLPVSSLDVSVCGEGYTFCDSVYTTSGKYYCGIGAPGNCGDSVVVLNLNLLAPVVQPVITVEERILGVVLSYTTYQWYLNGQEIVGATDSIYNVLENGDYTVVVTNDAGCVDTSEIYNVTNVGISDPKEQAPLLVYPNPVRDHIYIGSQIPVTIIITDIAGRRIKSVKAAKSLWVADLTPGVYLVELRNPAGQLIQVNRVVML